MNAIEQFRQLPEQGWRLVFPEKSIPLYSMLLHGGHETRDNRSYSWHGLKRGNHEFAIWQLTLAGEGALLHEKQTYHLRAGDAMLLHIPHDHCYYLPAHSEHWEFVYVGLNGRDVLRVWRIIEKSAGPVISLNPHGETANVTLRIFELARNNMITNAYHSSSLAYQMIMALAADYMPNYYQMDPEPENLKKVINYCLHHYQEPLPVSKMAEIAGYSRYHFTREFTRYHGVPPARFLRELRLKQSVQMLQTELSSIKEIAEQCGFEDVSYFCKVFRKYFGYPPGYFRRSLNLESKES